MSPLAVLLVLAAATAHASWNIIAHGASRSGLAFLWCASLASTVLWAGVVPFTGGLPRALDGFLLGIGVSALLHVAYLLVLQHGYRVGELSTVYATARGSGPLLTVLAAIAVLGERPSGFALAGALLIVAGVVSLGLVNRRPVVPRSRTVDPGIVAGLLTGVAIAAYTLWDTYAVRTWEISPVAFMVGCTLLQLPLFSIALGRRHGEVLRVARTEWRPLLVFGLLSPLSYILVLAAVQLAPVALVAPMREVSVVLVSLFGVLALRETRPGWRLAASALVVAGVVLMAF